MGGRNDVREMYRSGFPRIGATAHLDAMMTRGRVCSVYCGQSMAMSRLSRSFTCDEDYRSSFGSGGRLVTPSRLSALINVAAHATAAYWSFVKTLVACS